MQPLQFLIDEITKGRNLHISIIDLSKILSTHDTKLKFKNQVHMINFCNIAKSTSRGYKICQHSKRFANQKAIKEKTPFGGYCAYGLYEVAHPVISEDDIVAIVYVGNAVIDEEESLARAKKSIRHSASNPEKLCCELKNAEHLKSPEELFRIAELVADYLLILYNNAPKVREKKMHWLVSLMKNHADELFRTEISLKELSETYQKSEKYLGRLFKSEIGVSFSEYKQNKRLDLAESLIAKGNDKIIDIALECGFNNISYFNRSFQKKYGVSPTLYRKKIAPRKGAQKDKIMH